MTDQITDPVAEAERALSTLLYDEPRPNYRIYRFGIEREFAELLMARARRYAALKALAVLARATDAIAGDRNWHKGHQGKTCPLVVEGALREALEKEIAGAH